MDLEWLWRNTVNCWRSGETLGDSVKRLHWTYSPSLPRFLSPGERIIGLTYPPPIGSLRFLVRANGGSDAFILGEVFDHQYYELGLDAEPATILDLGANAGFTATYFARRYPCAALACVEPWPPNVRVLERNLALNQVKADLIQAAVAVRDGSLWMEEAAMDFGHRIVEFASPASRTREVPAMSVPTIMRRLGWSRIGLLKVDIEGYEKILFAGACEWLHLVDVACIECHEGFGEPELRRVADRHGFAAPRQLPGIWVLVRSPSHSPGAADNVAASQRDRCTH